MSRPRRRQLQLGSGNEKLITAVASVLHLGRSSRFQFEASCRHGLRKEFCLNGVSWLKSDERAAAVVREALHQIGAVRPTFSQGQPEWTQDGVYLIEYRYCVHCGKPIEVEPTHNGKVRKYCSSNCVTYAHADRVRRGQDTVSRAEWLVRCAAQSARTPKCCEGCGTLFVPRYTGARFCSHPCANKNLDRTQKEKAWIPCECCGKAFFPERKETRCCSISCAAIVRCRKRKAKAA